MDKDVDVSYLVRVILIQVMIVILEVFRIHERVNSVEVNGTLQKINIIISLEKRDVMDIVKQRVVLQIIVFIIKGDDNLVIIKLKLNLIEIVHDPSIEEVLHVNEGIYFQVLQDILINEIKAHLKVIKLLDGNLKVYVDRLKVFVIVNVISADIEVNVEGVVLSIRIKGVIQMKVS